MGAQLFACLEVQIGELTVQFVVQLAVVYGNVLGNVRGVALGWKCGLASYGDLHPAQLLSR